MTNCWLHNHQIGDSNTYCSLEHTKKKVQWKMDVEVIYYAADDEGGCMLHRETQPLCEEEEQQACAKGYVKGYTKNFLAMNHYSFTEP
jgi:hypothetical protein